MNVQECFNIEKHYLKHSYRAISQGEAQRYFAQMRSFNSMAFGFRPVFLSLITQ